MDIVTHALLGVTLSEAAGLRQRIGKSANWLAAAAAMLPDIDVWNFTGDPWTSLEFHRGATHSMFVAPLLALLSSGIFWLVRRRQFGAMYLLALLAGVSHPILDLATSYGTQLFWPISHARFQFDVLPIVDVIFTPILALTIFACWKARRKAAASNGDSWNRPAGGAAPAAHAAHAAHPVHPVSPLTIARLGLALAGVYVGVCIWADVRSHQIALATVPKGQGAILAVRAGPLIGTTFARRLVVQTPDGFYVARLNLLLTEGDPHWRWAPNDKDSSFVKRANELDRFKLFRWFADGMVRSQVEIAGRPLAGGSQTQPDTDLPDRDRWLARVTVYDMRYGYPADSARSIFSAYVIFDAVTGQVVVGPTTPRGSNHDSAIDGAAAYFQPPASPSLRGQNPWDRIQMLWQEAWRP